MDTTGVIQLSILILLILLSGFFSSAETAFTTARRAHIAALAEEGNVRAALVDRILEQYSKMLSAILIGNNLVNLSASSLATTLTIRILGNRMIGIVTGILTFVILLVGEIIPKTWAVVSGEKIACAYAPFIRFLMWLLTPLILIIDGLSSLILKIFRVDASNKLKPISESELKTYVDVSHESGNIEKEERQMIYNVFDFTDSLAKDIMIPRVDMTVISAQSTYEELLSLFRTTMFTRIPVYDNDPDNCIGIVNIKDLIIMGEEPKNFRIGDILREVMYTYEYKKTADLMMEMRAASQNVALVLSEYGETVGMITMEDLLEEIVGEIRDEYDEDEDELIQALGEGCYLIKGSMKVDDINDAIGTKLHSEDYDSIGGLMIECLQRLPEPEESIELDDGSILQAKGIVQNRILKVMLTLPEPLPNAAESDDAISDAE